MINGSSSIDDAFKKREVALLESVAGVMSARAEQTIAELLAKRESQLMRAVSDIVQKYTRLPDVVVSPSEVSVAAPQVYNKVDVPSVNVLVDMAPVAEAITEAFSAMRESMSLLVETLLRQPAAPIQDQPKREPRKITITHTDGSKSVVKEE